MKALINSCLYDFKSYHKNSYVLYDKEIIETGDMKNFPGADEIYNCSGCLIMPGLTNCHTHIYSVFSRGMNVPFNPQCFKDILTQLWWKLDAKLDKRAVYLSGLTYGIDCIKSGVTSIIDHHASGLNICGTLDELKKSICDELGLRGIFCFETSDRFNVDECIEENLKFSKVKTNKTAGLFGMHASMSLCDDTLKKISDCLEGMPVHIHVAESQGDEDDCMNKYGKSIVKRLDDFNLLTPDSILAHCVHINEEEAEILSRKGCCIAMNPTSNMNNAVGIADYDMYRRNNIKCMIGNDGLGANITRDYLNIVFAIKNRLKSPAGFNLDDLINLIENGYEYIGKILNIKIGKIEKGYAADMIAVPYDPPSPINSENAMGHVFFGVFDNFHPKYVFVSGDCLLKNYELNFYVNDIYKLSQVEAKKVWQRINENQGVK